MIATPSSAPRRGRPRRLAGAARRRTGRTATRLAIRSRRGWLETRAGILPAARAAAWASPEAWWVVALPSRARHALRLAPPPPGQRRLEVGSGHWPHPGYVHVDRVATSTAVDLVAPGHRLPLPDRWADEVLSVHMIEHLAPPMLAPTLSEWHRVLRAGGTLTIHTPNGESLARSLLAVDDPDSATLWAVQNAIYGYWLAPRDVGSPAHFTASPDHKVLMTLGLVERLLSRAGFTDITDVTGRDECHHLQDWAPLVPGLCLEVEARRSP